MKVTKYYINSQLSLKREDINDVTSSHKLNLLSLGSKGKMK